MDLSERPEGGGQAGHAVHQREDEEDEEHGREAVDVGAGRVALLAHGHHLLPLHSVHRCRRTHLARDARTVRVHLNNFNQFLCIIFIDSFIANQFSINY